MKLFIENNLLEELKYFQKKYSFKINIFSDKKFIIPEYKIDLINKSKKILKTIENIKDEFENKKINVQSKKKKKQIIKDTEKTKNKKTKLKKKIRTLWVRRKKN